MPHVRVGSVPKLRGNIFALHLWMHPTHKCPSAVHNLTLLLILSDRARLSGALELLMERAGSALDENGPPYEGGSVYHTCRLFHAIRERNWVGTAAFSRCVATDTKIP